MPLNVRRYCTSILLVLFSFITVINAQTTSGDVMRDRISKAKAYIAVRNYNAAVFELENIRKETNDASVHAVANVLLMNSYLEQGDYKRAQDFLNEFYKSYKSNNANASTYYYAVAGQIVSGARNRVERYRALGLNVSDRNLPLEAVNDIEKMRETLELVVAQAKEASADKARTADAVPLLEEASNSRSLMARDDYDARRWRDEVGDAREQIASSRSVVINAVAAPPDTLVAQNSPAASGPAADQRPAAAPQQTAPTFKPVAAESKPKTAEPAPALKEEPKKAEPAPNVSQPKSEPARSRVVAGSEAKKEDEPAKPAEPTAAESGPIEIGSLIAYATEQAAPVYPVTAKNMRTTGVVKVEVVINEEGQVDEIQNASGPSLLQGAAKDAIKKWKFKPFLRDGQPVKATGFVSFNFSL